MSRTDKTRPFHVKMADHPRRYREVHDHRDRECDLPASPLNDENWRRNRGCHYAPSNYFLGLGESNCPCWMCHGSWRGKADVRRERYEGRRQAMNWED